MSASITAGDICTRHRASIDGRLCKKDFTGGVVVCQKSWPKNRPIQRSPCLQVFLRCRLRLQVGGKNLVGVLRYFVTSTHGADLNEPTHSRFLGGIGQQHRRSSVYGVLPLDRAARSGARGEDRDVGTVEYLRNFLDRGGFQIDHHGERAECADRTLVRGVADQRYRPITMSCQQVRQVLRDLAVPTGNDHAPFVHTSMFRHRFLLTSRYFKCSAPEVSVVPLFVPRVRTQRQNDGHGICNHLPQSRCNTSRTVLGLIRDAGIEPTIVKYLDTPPTRSELEKLLADAGLEPSQAVRKRETQFKELGLADASESEILDAMIEHPILIERPFVVTDKGTVLARPAAKVEEIL